MSQVKHPLTSNVYLKALLQTSKKNDLKLAQEKALTKQQLESVEKKMPTLLTGKQELANRLHQKRSHSSVFIPDYGYLDSADLRNHSTRDIIRDINAQKYINQVLQQRQDLVPKIDYLTEAEKQALIKERENLPFVQQQLIKQLVDNNANYNAQNANYNVQLAQTLENIYRQQEQNNQLQTENAKLDTLVALLNPEGKAQFAKYIDGYDLNDPNVIAEFSKTLRNEINQPNFRKYLVQYTDDIKHQEIKDLLEKQYNSALNRQSGPSALSNIAAATGSPSGASGYSPPPPTTTTSAMTPYTPRPAFTPTTTTPTTTQASASTAAPPPIPVFMTPPKGITRLNFSRLNDDDVLKINENNLDGTHKINKLAEYLNVTFKRGTPLADKKVALIDIVNTLKAEKAKKRK